jgi:predicted neuraminidase
VLRLAISSLLTASLVACSQPFVTLRDFTAGPGSWQINSRQGKQSQSRVLPAERNGDPCVELKAVFQSGWEAFKTAVPAGLVPKNHRALTFLAKGDPGVRAVEVRLGLADGSWWRATHKMEQAWTRCALRREEFVLCKGADHGETGAAPELASLRWLQFEPLVARKPGTYMVWVDEIQTTRHTMKPLPHTPYRPAHKNAWDFWFAQDGPDTHAFYLEYPDAATQPDQSGRHGHQWIGHAVSRDLWHWREVGPALEPGKGNWQTEGLATGSVVRAEDGWYMLHTCRGLGKSGLALARSQDLTHWEKLGDGPVVRAGTVFDFPWQDATIRLRPLADPYIYPEKRDGWWVMICNSHVVGSGENERGATGMWRSRDLRQWEPYRVIAWPGTFERMETSQIWENAGHWYLYFGGGHTQHGNANYIYQADAWDGVYTARPWSKIDLPDGNYFYIGKVIQRPEGDVFLAGQSYSSLSAPYPLAYGDNGAVSLSDPGAPAVATRLVSVCQSTPGPASAAYPRNTEGSLLVRRDGSYLLAFTRFEGEARDDSKASIVGTVSQDDGRTWGKPSVLQENTGGCNVMSASLLRLDNGTVLLGYIRKDSHASCTVFVRRSEDDGETFGDPIQVNSWQAYMGIVNDSLVQLSTGRLVCPIYFSKAPCWTPEEHYVARMCLSDDGGQTWHAAKTDVDCPKRGAMEPVVLEQLDGSLAMLIRTQMGAAFRSVSRDGGETWTPAERSPLPSQEAPIAVRRIPGRELSVAVWNADYQPGAKSHGGRRTSLRVAVSRDGFASPVVPHRLVHAKAETFSYPSISFTDKRLLLTYYVGSDEALVGGGTTARLSLRFQALDLAELLGQ